MLRPAPTDGQISSNSLLIRQNYSRSKLLNFTGFFSGMVDTPVTGVTLILWDSLVEERGPDQGKRMLLCKRECERGVGCKERKRCGRR